MTDSPSLLVGDDELVQLTGCRQAAAQLRELHRQGFWRARRLATSGDVVLERAHYEAVCAGDAAPSRRGRAEGEYVIKSQRRAA